MPRILYAKKYLNLKRPKGITGGKLAMCQPEDEIIVELTPGVEELVGKLSQMRITNPVKYSQVKKNKRSGYISL